MTGSLGVNERVDKSCSKYVPVHKTTSLSVEGEVPLSKHGGKMFSDFRKSNTSQLFHGRTQCYYNNEYLLRRERNKTSSFLSYLIKYLLFLSLH